jgi:hypothetical protein
MAARPVTSGAPRFCGISARATPASASVVAMVAISVLVVPILGELMETG